jgi:hypothetical protein
MVDQEGFQYRYVPKEAISVPEASPPKKGSRKGSRKYSNLSESSGKAKEKFVYVKKQ